MQRLSLGAIAFRSLSAIAFRSLSAIAFRSLSAIAFLALAFTSAPSPAAVHPHGKAMRFLALGDSYTIGEGVAPESRWPVQLATRLRHEGVALEAPEIIARTGWTTDELDAAIDGAKPHGPYALVTLLIGVNDQYRGRDVAEFPARFTALLQRAIGFAGGDASRVVVVSIPDWGVTAFAEGRDRNAIAQAIDAYNTVAREAAHKAGAHYADVTIASRRLGASSESLANDGLHPSAAQYTAWVEAIAPAAHAALARRAR